MEQVRELLQSADWKTEKHVPVIEVPDHLEAGEMIKVKVSVGKEVAHPNTTAHHIAWIALYFHPKGEKFPHELARLTFSAHGASAQGPDTSTVYTHHGGEIAFKTDHPGTLLAMAYCNIHGLWQNSKDIRVG